MGDDDVFVIAVKREQRTDVPQNWRERVRETEGVTVLGDSSPFRMQVRATADAIQRVQDDLANYIYVERLVPHHLL